MPAVVQFSILLRLRESAGRQQIIAGVMDGSPGDLAGPTPPLPSAAASPPPVNLHAGFYMRVVSSMKAAGGHRPCLEAALAPGMMQGCCNSPPCMA